jgi:hypothetical protein
LTKNRADTGATTEAKIMNDEADQPKDPPATPQMPPTPVNRFAETNEQAPPRITPSTPPTPSAATPAADSGFDHHYIRNPRGQPFTYRWGPARNNVRKYGVLHDFYWFFDELRGCMILREIKSAIATQALIVMALRMDPGGISITVSRKRMREELGASETALEDAMKLLTDMELIKVTARTPGSSNEYMVIRPSQNPRYIQRLFDYAYGTPATPAGRDTHPGGPGRPTPVDRGTTPAPSIYPSTQLIPPPTAEGGGVVFNLLAQVMNPNAAKQFEARGVTLEHARWAIEQVRITKQKGKIHTSAGGLLRRLLEDGIQDGKLFASTALADPEQIKKRTIEHLIATHQMDRVRAEMKSCVTEHHWMQIRDQDPMRPGGLQNMICQFAERMGLAPTDSAPVAKTAQAAVKPATPTNDAGQGPP